MSVLARALRLKQVVEVDAAWDLLRKTSDHATVAAAILAEPWTATCTRRTRLRCTKRWMPILRSCEVMVLTFHNGARVSDRVDEGWLSDSPGIAVTRGELFEAVPMAWLRFVFSSLVRRRRRR